MNSNIDNEIKILNEIEKHFQKVENYIKINNLIYPFNKCKYILGCSKAKVYGYKNGPRLYCKKHKLPNMINLVSKKCIISDCDKVAFFNYIGYKKQYCNIHKKPNMINIIKQPSCIKIEMIN